MTDLVTLRARAKETPDASISLVRLGQQMLAIQAFDDAIEVFQRAERAEPQDVERKLLLTRALVAGGRVQDAKALGAGFTPPQPAATDTLRQLFKLYLMWNDEARATAALQEILARPDRRIEDHTDYVRILLKRRRGSYQAKDEMTRFQEAWSDAPNYRLVSIVLRIDVAAGEPRPDSKTIAKNLALMRDEMIAKPDDLGVALQYAGLLVRFRRRLRVRLLLGRLLRRPRIDAEAITRICTLAGDVRSRRLVRRAALRAMDVEELSVPSRLLLATALWEQRWESQAREMLQGSAIETCNNPHLLQQIAKLARRHGVDDIAETAIKRLSAILPEGAPAVRELAKEREAGIQASALLRPRLAS